MESVLKVRKKAPESAVFQITYRCNYQCTFCLNEIRANPEKKSAESTFENQKKIDKFSKACGEIEKSDVHCLFAASIPGTAARALRTVFPFFFLVRILGIYTTFALGN